jgi:acyl-CoA thioesterase I
MTVKSCSSRMIAALLLAASAGCARGARESPGPAPTAAPTAAATPAAAGPVVMVLGTSLTAGLGVAPEEAYPALIQRRIDAAALRFQVVNAGVSGETSAGARRRLEWLLDNRDVAVLLIETGGNDGLRAQDAGALRENVEAMIARAGRETPPPRVVLVGMQAPPNYGADYAARFRALFPELAARHHLPLVPFLLEGVAGVPALNQADGIHPTPEGHRLMAETVWKVLGPVLREDAQRSGG